MDGLGTELPQRTTIMWILLAAAVVFLVPTARTARRALGESGGTAAGLWAMSAVMVVLLVVVPLRVARSIQQRHTYLSDDAVTVVSGDDRRTLAFADLEEVKVRYSTRGGSVFRNEKVFLVGRSDRGERTVITVSRYYVETMQPLLRRLAVEVDQRPGLLDGDLERDYFDHALRSAP
ncbi:hypothetical protein [Nocardioides ganghwensis]|uniref:PH domain-containing protein n=1 Tax=Nocardioides ganghwensis TaxID=252230 RepID=A0A4Q2S962_9ACTN|nr:hypothetical protein [Nocardioides ganghwensis]MBD3947324.1 hypothetical protein [Nocardioides ganghwensis]RYC00269.1 hypothetical protein EUA07_14110 [Nocardioides ganghwensis]